LYYARAVDPTLLPVANEIASQQATSNPTLKVLQAANRLLSYCTAHRDKALTYHACDMALHIHMDASYATDKVDPKSHRLKTQQLHLVG
jgi:hypothetical protein